MAERVGEHKPSIEGGIYKRTSVSQIRSFKSCEVAWGMDKIDHVPRAPPTKGQDTGTQGHGEVEILLKDGADIRGPIARAGDSMLTPYTAAWPSKGGFGLVEWPLIGPAMRTHGGVEIIGYPDFSLLLNDIAIVIDHKFKKKIALPPKGYGTSIEELADDEQAIIYGHWAAEHYRTELAFFELHQYQTEGKKIFEPVSRLFTATELAEKFEALIEFVDKQMAPAAKATRARDLKPNTASCAKYRGCQYARICPFSPQNRFIASIDPTWQPPAAIKKEGSTLGLLDVVNPTLPNTPPPSGTAATTLFAPSYPAAFHRIPVLACKPENAYGLVDGKSATFKIEMQGVYYFIRDGKTIPMTATDTVVDLGGAAYVKTDAAILAPDAPKSEPNGAAAPGTGLTPGGRPRIPIVDVPSTETAAATTAPATTTTPAATTATANPSADPAAKPEEATKGKRGRPAGSTNGITLLIDCACSTETTDLNVLVASFAKQLAEKAGLPDLRLAPKKETDGGDHPLAFGGWRAVLSMAVLNNLPKGDCSINSGELNDPVIEALAGVAAKVIRGRR